MTIVLRCPDPPPSVNRAWRMFRNRMVRSKEFKSWEAQAIESFSRSPERLPSSCYWSTRIFVPVIQNRPDLDNMLKGVHDAIVRSGIAPDDRYLVKSRQEYWPGEYLIVHVTEEKLEQWQAILKTSPMIAKRMAKAKLSSVSPRLV